VFIFVVPLAVLALAGTFAFVRDLARKGKPQLDWLDSGEILLLIFVGGMSLYVFLIHTFTHDKPFISPHLFLDRNFSIGLVVVFVYDMLNFTPIVLLLPLLQNLKGYPDSLIGLLLAMRGAGLSAGFFIAMMNGPP
jgi:DHA2 family multidrug resistance protein